MKPWQTKQWKEMRKQRIGDRCKQCGSTDGPFVLQHFSHEQPEPPSKHTLVWELINEYGLYPGPPTIQKAGCPECRRSSLSERRTKTPKWRCIKCHNEFDDPIFDDPIQVQVRSDSSAGKDEYNKWLGVRRDVYNDFLAEHGDVVEQRYGAALADYEAERQASDRKYMSGEGTATFCKKCAFLWDKKDMRLCANCKEHYHHFRYETCFNCIPQWRKEEIEGAQKFAAEMDTVMESLEAAYDEDGETAAP